MNYIVYTLLVALSLSLSQYAFRRMQKLEGRSPADSSLNGFFPFFVRFMKTH